MNDALKDLFGLLFESMLHGERTTISVMNSMIRCKSDKQQKKRLHIIGYINLDREAANLFFQLISMRYEHKSTIITTNKNLSKWGDIFGEPVIANAILDRLLHHSHIINIIGPSYRIKDILDKLEE